MITELRGVNFRPKDAKDIVRKLDETSTLRLQRDPENPYDHNAIQVIDVKSNEFIGFVAKEDNEALAQKMGAGATFAVVYHTRSGDLSVMLEIIEAEESDGYGTDSEPNDDGGFSDDDVA